MISGSLFSLLLSQVLAAQFDPPDLKLEQEFHRQYQQRLSVLQPIASSSPGYLENYRIQKGETLWSLSEILYGDGQFWPRVWAQNESISNPSLIKPGHVLQFVLGSEDETPSFRFTEEESSGIELAAASNTQNALIEVPPPEIPPKPVIKLPRSFPQWQSVFKQQPVQITDDRGLLKKHKPLPRKTYLTSYVEETPLVPAGFFMETDLDSSLPVVNQYVFVKVKKGMGQPGLKMLVVKDVGQLKKMSRTVDMPEAFLMQITGQLVLTETAESIDEDTQKEFDVFRALITQSTGGLPLRGMALVPGELQEITLDYMGSPGTAEAHIIGSGHSKASGLYSPGDIVFLDQGSTSGLAVDQILDVYADRTTRKREAEVKYSPANSGTLRVVRVTPRLATAVLLGTRDGLMPGDKIKQASAKGSGDREVMEKYIDHGVKGLDESDLESDLDEDDLESDPKGEESDDPDFGDEF